MTDMPDAMWPVEALQSLGVPISPSDNHFTYTFPPPHHAKAHGHSTHAWFGSDDWKDVSLYLHVPFCEMDCDFCSLHRSVLMRPSDLVAYLEALCEELRLVGSHLGRAPLGSVYIGGGTPTVMTLPQFDKVLNAIASHFAVVPHCELTVEAAPHPSRSEQHWTHRLRHLTALAPLPVTRLSFGLQSFDPSALSRMGRHTYEAFGSLLRAADGVMGVYNLDLVFGYPGAAMSPGKERRSIRAGLAKLLGEGYRLPSVSLYQLWDSGSVRLARRREPLAEASELLTAKWELQQDFVELGYRPSVVSSFVREGWMEHAWILHRLQDFRHVGVGSGIYSILPNSLVQRPRDVPGYIAAVRRARPWENDVTYELGPDEKAVRKFIMGLRTSGWTPAPTVDVGSHRWPACLDVAGRAQQLARIGALEADPQLGFRLPATSFLLANEISAFLHPISHPRWHETRGSPTR